MSQPFNNTTAAGFTLRKDGTLVAPSGSILTLRPNRLQRWVE
jgi:hypothetical protein